MNFAVKLMIFRAFLGGIMMDCDDSQTLEIWGIILGLKVF
jgi:hypothetical protein